jgi:hypothetical protein
MSWGDYYDPKSIAASSGMSPDAIYNKAMSDWYAMPIEDRLKSRGYVFTMDDTGGTWTAPDGSIAGVGTDGPIPNWQDQAAAWDPRQFVDQYRILPLSGKYNGNIDYTDASVAPQGAGNLNQWLSFVTNGTGGTIYTDKSGDKWFVPKDPSTLDPYRDFAPHSGGWLTDTINNFVGSGGLVAALAGGIGGLSGAISAAAPAAAPAAAAPTSIVDQIVSNLPSVSTMAQNAAINAATQLVSTGNVDPAKVLTSVATGAAGTAVGATVGQDVLSATDSPLAASVASGATKGALQAALTGGDIINTAAASAAASGLGSVAKDAGINVPQPVINAVVNSVASGAPLSQTLTGAALTIGTGLAKDAVLGTQPPAPVDTGVPSTPDQSAVDVSAAPQVTPPTPTPLEPIDQSTVAQPSGALPSGTDQVQTVDQQTSQPPLSTQVAGTSQIDTSSALPYQNAYTGTYVSDTGQVPPVIGDYVQPSTDTVVASTPSALPPAVQPSTTDQSGALPATKLPEVTVTAPPEPPVVADTTPAPTPAPAPAPTPTPAPAPKPVTTTVPIAQQVATPAQPISLPTGLSGVPSLTGTTGTPSGVGWLTKPESGFLSYKAAPIQNTQQQEQLNSLLAGLDPVLRGLFQQKGIAAAGGGSIHFDDGGLTVSQNPMKQVSDALSTLKDAKMQEFKPKFLTPRTAATGFPKAEYSPLKQMAPISRVAKGGLPKEYHEASPKGHNPEFITGITGFYADGRGTGQSDDIPALLHDGDYVMDAETVSALGDGSSKAGREVLDKFRNQVPHEAKVGGHVVPAKIADGEYVFPSSFVSALGKGDNKRGAEILDGLRKKLREHKRKAPLDKIPPKAKSPLDYMKGKV